MLSLLLVLELLQKNKSGLALQESEYREKLTNTEYEREGKLIKSFCLREVDSSLSFLFLFFFKK